jgi:predicted nuclease of predicted toxin-antitoxin system
VTVEGTVGKGTPDLSVGQFARDEDRVLVTTDRDFLDPELSGGLRVLLVADDRSEAAISPRRPPSSPVWLTIRAI